LVKRIYKEAGGGKFPQYSYYFYKKYRAKFQKPKLVIYGCDYFMFSRNSNGLGMVRMGTKWTRENMAPDQETSPSVSWLGRTSWLYRMKPKIDEFLTDMCRLDERPEDEEALPLRVGSELIETRGLARNADRGVRGVAIHEPRNWAKQFYHPFPGREGLYLQGLLDALGRDGVPTFMVFIPEYIGSYETNFEQRRFKDDIRRLASSYPKVHVLDFDTPEKFDLMNLELFWDGGWGVTNSHLNDEGMRLFSRQLAAAIQSSLLAGGH